MVGFEIDISQDSIPWFENFFFSLLQTKELQKKKNKPKNVTGENPC